MRRSVILTTLLACAGIFSNMPVRAGGWDDGPLLDFGLELGVQQTAIGTDSNGNNAYTEGTEVWSMGLVSLAWGVQTGSFHWLPTFYIGSGSAMIDGGKALGIFDAKFDTFSGRTLGGGLNIRVSMTDTRARFGLDFRYLAFSDESDFIVNGSSSPMNADFQNVSVGLVLDYDDPDYKPFFSLGMMALNNKFEDISSPGNYVKIHNAGMFGAKAGVVFRRLFGSGLNFTMEFGYYGGLTMKLGLAYQFS